MRRFVIAFFVIAFGLVHPSAGSTYALVVNGVNKDPDDRLVKSSLLQSLRQYLSGDVRVAPANLIVLDADSVSTPPTRDALAKTMSTLASRIGPQDRFVFYYMGQANAVAQSLRLNLPGDDIAHQDLAGWLQQIRATSQLVVLDCPCAGLAVKALAGPGRIVVCATTQEQVYTPIFGSYFIPLLAQSDSDSDADGKISLLEAFTATARQIEKWYRDREIVPTETPCLDDNGDGIPSEQPWRYNVESVDGSAAAKYFLTANQRVTQ